MTPRCKLLAGHAAIAVVIGIARTGFQSAVDTGQYWAGLVDYPLDNAFGQYLQQMVDAQTLGTALLLSLGVNELLISGLFTIIGLFFYLAAFCNITYYLTQSHVLSLLLPLFILHTGFGLYGINYEIVVPPGQLTFAPFAIAYSAFFLTNTLYERRLWNHVAAAMVILVHPLWGVYASIAQTLSLLVSGQVDRFFRAGVVLAVSLVCALILAVISPPYAQADFFSTLIVTNPSKHRVPIGVSRDLIFLGLNMTVFLALMLRRTGAEKLVAAQAFMLAVIGLLFSVVYLIPAGELGSLLRLVYQSIPNRNCNLLQLLGPAVVLCYVCTLSRKFVYVLLGVALIYWLLVLLSLARMSRRHLLEGLPLQWGSPFATWEVVVYTVAAAITLYVILSSRQLPAVSKPDRRWSVSLTALALILLSWQNFLYAHQFEQRNVFYQNDPALAAARRLGSGGVLVAGIDNLGKHFPQARTRAPMVYDVQITAVLPYLRRSPDKTLELAREVFGLDLLAAERSMRIHQPCDALDCESVRLLLSDRSIQEWEKLSAKYGFTVVLVPHTWTIELPLVAESRIWRAYRPEAR